MFTWRYIEKGSLFIMSNIQEIWKDIPNYEGYYQVSNYGNVKSLDRFINNRYDTISLRCGKILKFGTNKKGYYSVTLNALNKRKTFTVHKLVAMAFLNHKPCGMNNIIDHKDNNKKNNELSNLQITNNRHNASKDRSGYTSSYIGVFISKNKKKWCSQIRIGNKRVYLGTFNTEIEASNAYQKKLKDINA